MTLLKKTSIFLLLSLSLFANSLQLKDQFGRVHTLDTNATLIIYAQTKKAATICNDLFSTKDEAYFKQHHFRYIVDISSVPYFVQRFFILPKMQHFKFDLYISDAKSRRFFKKIISKKEYIALITMQKGAIKAIEYIDTKKALRTKLQKYSISFGSIKPSASTLKCR